MSAGAPGSHDRCVVCGKHGRLHFHHLAGVRHLPGAVLPVCASRHAAWHRRLRGAGIDLAPSSDVHRELLRAVTVGFGVVCEDAAPLASNPASTRAMVRADIEAMLIQADTGTERSIVAPAVRRLSSPPAPGEGPRDCRARRPRSLREAQRRSLSFAAGMLGALAGVLDAVLPAEIAHLDLPARLRAMQDECRRTLEAMSG